MLNHLNAISGTNIKEGEVFTFEGSWVKQMFINGKLYYKRESQSSNNGWALDDINYNTLVGSKIVRRFFVGDIIESPSGGDRYEIVQWDDGTIRLRDQKSHNTICRFPSLEVLAEYTKGWRKV